MRPRSSLAAHLVAAAVGGLLLLLAAWSLAQAINHFFPGNPPASP